MATGISDFLNILKGKIPSAPPKVDKNAVVTFLKFFFRTDLLFATGISLIILILILPMPTWLLDVSLAFSLTFSVLIFMTVIFIEKPIDFSVFPTILLVSTLLRLSLNLASTRLILSHGHEGMSAAGEMIKAFGMFIMGGNFVIGIIVFAILVIVNFVVITKGSGRIAEVSARFNLDSMPGKQMAIDADLSAGLINEEQAKNRRKELEIETNFYGSMDGAAKFVRGDAIAGLLITFINIIAGIIIGVVQKGLTFRHASETYTLLTVGDGLVSQIPSLIVSTAAGMLVSKSSAVGSTDKIMLTQLGAYPSSMGMTAFLMVCFSVLPGIPRIPFLILAGIIGYVAFSIVKNDAKAESEAKAEGEEKEKTEEDEMAENLKMENIKIELGMGLLSLMQPDEKHNLTNKIKILRKEVANSMGFIIPQIRIKDNLQNSSNEFVIKIKESEATRGNVYTGKLMIVTNGEDIGIEGIKDKDPYFNLDVLWIDENKKDEAEESGYHVIDPASVVITSLNQVVQNYIHEIFSYSDTVTLLNTLDENHQKLLKEITPAQISITTIQRVLQELLSENISIKDLETILESIAESAPFVKTVSGITENVRAKLKRQITSMVMSEDGVVHIVALTPDTEQQLASSLIDDGENLQIGYAPNALKKLIRNLANAYQDAYDRFGNAALVVSDKLRKPIRNLVERSMPEMRVISQREIYQKVKLDIAQQIALED